MTKMNLLIWVIGIVIILYILSELTTIFDTISKYLTALAAGRLFNQYVGSVSNQVDSLGS